MPRPLGPGAKVAVLTLNAECTGLAAWEALARRLGWSVRALVGVPATHGDGTAVVRGRRVVLQTAPADDAEDLLRRYAGVVSDPSLDAIVLAANPDALTADDPGRPIGSVALRCHHSLDRIVGSRDLAELGVVALSPAAIRTLLYLPAAARPGAVHQFGRAAAEFLSRHVTWRLRRQAPATRPPAH